MELHAFLHLPDTDATIIDAVQDEAAFNAFIKNVYSTVKRLRQEPDAKLYYDSENISNFLRGCQYFNNEKYLANANYQIKGFINTNSIDIKTKPLKDNCCLYVLWNYDKAPTVNHAPPQTIAEIVERATLYPQNKYLLLNIENNIAACRDVLLAFKDLSHQDNLPTNFIRIPFTTDEDELELWLRTNHIKKFSLLNKARFKRVGRMVQGKPVFQDVKNGQFWYMDNLHKNEYEVFSSKMMHIGTATLCGIMNPNSQIAGRRLSL